MPAQTLESYRKGLGLSQEQLADRLGLNSKGFISRLESGAQDCSLRLALKIDLLSEGVVPATSVLNADDSDLLRRFLARRQSPAAAA